MKYVHIYAVSSFGHIFINNIHYKVENLMILMTHHINNIHHKVENLMILKTSSQTD